MKRVSLVEAARQLGISRDAAYKRVHRGTLAHKKGEDGRMYVYMDDTEASAQESDGGNQNTERSWLDYAAGASGLLVIFGGLVYALGLFALWAPIARANTHDLVTAWHATSLVPKTVVAGLGVRQLVAFPLFAAVVVFAVTFCIRQIWGSSAVQYVVYVIVVAFSTWRISTGPLAQLSFLEVFLMVSLLGLAFLATYLSINSLFSRIYKVALVNAFSIPVWAILAFFYTSTVVEADALVGSLINAALVVGAATVVYVGALEIADDVLSPSRLHGGSWGLRRSFLVVLLTTFVAAFLLAIPSRPPLPKVVIEGETVGEVKGTLLTHADAFWYVFEQENGQPGSRLTAIPDGEVKTARVSKRTE